MVTRERVLVLFNQRNRIAHGALLENEIDTLDLVDFETLVRNSILSFVMKEWGEFREFKLWVKESVGYNFQPKQ